MGVPGPRGHLTRVSGEGDCESWQYPLAFRCFLCLRAVVFLSSRCAHSFTVLTSVCLAQENQHVVHNQRKTLHDFLPCPFVPVDEKRGTTTLFLEFVPLSMVNCECSDVTSGKILLSSISEVKRRQNNCMNVNHPVGHHCHPHPSLDQPKGLPR